MRDEEMIARLEQREAQIKIEKAFYNGEAIEAKSKAFTHGWYISNSPSFVWEVFDYRIVEERKRVPFDGSDAFNLVGQKFKHKDGGTCIFMCVKAGIDFISIGDFEFSYLTLSKDWTKWNDLLKVFEPCNKVA